MHCQYNERLYIERNNLQLDLIRYLKNVIFILVYFWEATDSMQYRPPIGHKNLRMFQTQTNSITVISGQ